jgi:hypothetical protein
VLYFRRLRLDHLNRRVASEPIRRGIDDMKPEY